MGDPVNAALAKALESVADLLQRIAGPLADEVGNSFAISYRPYRVKLGLKALQKTQRMLKEAGISPQRCRRNCSCQVEAASIEDDEDLHTRQQIIHCEEPGDRRDVSYKIAQSAEGATQPSPDREVGVQVGMKGSPEGRDT